MAVLDDDDDDDVAVPAATGSKKKLILIIVGVLLLVSAIAGTLYFTGILGGGGEDRGEAETTNNTEEVLKTAEGPAANGKMASGGTPIYFSFAQPFTVNFETEGGLRFLQVGIELMSHDQTAIDTVQANLPVIQNNIILLLSSQTYGTLISREGKEQLRSEALNEIQAVIAEYNKGAKLEAVYFSSFVIQ